MRNELEIRRGTLGDLPRFAHSHARDEAYARGAIARQARGESQFIVAWLREEYVGSAELTTDDEPELQNLHVRPNYRGKGYGSRIINAVEKIAAPRGAIVMGVALDNPDARRLYESLGYQPSGRLETYTYSYLDEQGITQTTTETAEYLRKPLNTSGTPA